MKLGYHGLLSFDDDDDDDDIEPGEDKNRDWQNGTLVQVMAAFAKALGQVRHDKQDTI
jgi:hypothetical protein